MATRKKTATKKSGRKKARSPAQKAATKRMLAANKASSSGDIGPWGGESPYASGVALERGRARRARLAKAKRARAAAKKAGGRKAAARRPAAKKKAGAPKKRRRTAVRASTALRGLETAEKYVRSASKRTNLMPHMTLPSMLRAAGYKKLGKKR